VTSEVRSPRPSLRAGPGRPAPLGATADACGVNFAVHSTAARLSLVLLDPHTSDVVGEHPFRAEHRVGTVHTLRLDGPGVAGLAYALRVHPADGRPPVLVHDPYTRAVTTTAWAERPRRLLTRIPVGDPVPPAAGTRPRTAPADLVIYEAHLRGFTRSATSAVRAPGTYTGMIEKIPHLLDLGVNCVELLPIAEFDETDNTYTDPGTGQPLLNYWGYNPVALFAPKAAYATDPGDPAGADSELASLVGALHRAGIRVVLDVVFNHTAEGDHRGPDHGLRALDEAAYYLLDADGCPRNLTATGNTVNANHPVARRLILDCLRHWVTRYGIDGFRFDMASILTRGPDGQVQANPPLLEAVSHDPVLADCLLIAEATDATGLDQVGTFPGHRRFSEWNGRYRDTVRRFLLARPGSTAAMATRLAGSPDLYPGRGPTASVNYITCHDGLTLADWTAYDHRHNHANGEGGRDGIPDEESWNHGHEGPTADARIRRLRLRQHRNGLALLLTSRGIPMLSAGDEFGRTQHGNNNAYSQDNPTSWLDWDLTRANAGLLAFTRDAIALRRAHPVLRRDEHPSGRTPPGWALPPVSWHGERPDDPDWGEHSTLLVARLYQQDERGRPDCVLIAANTAPDAVDIEVPAPPPGTRWHVQIDTAAALSSHPPGAGPALSGSRFTLGGRSVAVLTVQPDERTLP
jgi:isoamylase